MRSGFENDAAVVFPNYQAGALVQPETATKRNGNRHTPLLIDFNFY